MDDSSAASQSQIDLVVGQQEILPGAVKQRHLEDRLQQKGFYDNGTKSGTYKIDWSLGYRQKIVLSGNITFTYASANAGETLLLNIDQNATGGWTTTLPTGTVWPGGVAGTFTTTASALNTLVVEYDGSKYRTQLAAGFA